MRWLGVRQTASRIEDCFANSYSYGLWFISIAATRRLKPAALWFSIFPTHKVHLESVSIQVENIGRLVEG